MRAKLSIAILVAACSHEKPASTAENVASTPPPAHAVAHHGLELHAVDSDSAFMRAAFQHVAEDKAAGIKADTEQFKEVGHSQFTDYFLVGERSAIERYVTTDAQLTPPADRSFGYEQLGASKWRTYLLDTTTVLDATAIAQVHGAYDPMANRPIVVVELTPAGAKLLAEVTAKAVDKKLAWVLDSKVISAPIVDAPIPNGRVSIVMGGGDVAEMERARDELVNALRPAKH